MADNAKEKPLEAFNTDLSAPTCEAPAVSMQLGDRHTPTICHTKLTKYPLLLEGRL